MERAATDGLQAVLRKFQDLLEGIGVEDLKEADRVKFAGIRADYIKLLGKLEEFVPQDLALLKILVRRLNANWSRKC